MQCFESGGCTRCSMHGHSLKDGNLRTRSWPLPVFLSTSAAPGYLLFRWNEQDSRLQPSKNVMVLFSWVQEIFVTILIEIYRKILNVAPRRIENARPCPRSFRAAPFCGDTPPFELFYIARSTLLLPTQHPLPRRRSVLRCEPRCSLHASMEP